MFAASDQLTLNNFESDALFGLEYPIDTLDTNKQTHRLHVRHSHKRTISFVQSSPFAWCSKRIRVMSHESRLTIDRSTIEHAHTSHTFDDGILIMILSNDAINTQRHWICLYTAINTNRQTLLPMEFHCHYHHHHQSNYAYDYDYHYSIRIITRQ